MYAPPDSIAPGSFPPTSLRSDDGARREKILKRSQRLFILKEFRGNTARMIETFVKTKRLSEIVRLGGGVE